MRDPPPPWTVEELDACFVVSDHTGQALAYVYFEDEPSRRFSQNPPVFSIFGPPPRRVRPYMGR